MDDKILNQKAEDIKQAKFDIQVSVLSLDHIIELLELYKIPAEHTENLKFTVERMKKDLIDNGIL